MVDVPRVQAIWDNDAFQCALRDIKVAEAEREFCRHGIHHLLDVARVAWMLNLERGLGLEREVVYAAALLHDIGRSAQYATGEPHDEAGVRMARDILDALSGDLAFSEEETAEILKAVAGHRGSEDEGMPSDSLEQDRSLAALIYEADHRSRPCFACPAREACYWQDEKKNLSIRV